MQQECCFCSRSLRPVQEVLDHYNEAHGISKQNSPNFENYINAIGRDSPQIFVE